MCSSAVAHHLFDAQIRVHIPGDHQEALNKMEAVAMETIHAGRQLKNSQQLQQHPQPQLSTSPAAAEEEGPSSSNSWTSTAPVPSSA